MVRALAILYQSQVTPGDIGVYRDLLECNREDLRVLEVSPKGSSPNVGDTGQQGNLVSPIPGPILPPAHRLMEYDKIVGSKEAPFKTSRQ